MRRDVFLAGGVRTPIGRFGGGFGETPAPALGSAAAKAAIAVTGVEPDRIDEVLFGNVIGAGLGQNVARQVAIGAGLSVRVGATTINKVCGSGLKAVMLAAQAIQCGDASVVVAGGTENMSRAPYLLDRARTGYRLGHGQLIDATIHDGLWDVYNDVHMGTCGDSCADRYDFTREQQDDFAVESYRRALAAMQNGAFADEIVPVPTRAGTISEDEEPLRFDEERLRQLRPAFNKTGTVTAGNASSINDGAAAVLVLAEPAGGAAQARILGYATAAQEPEWFTTAPVAAIRSLLDQLGMKGSDVDLFEINEAFAVVPMVAMRELDIAHDRLNIHGGAVALGHPIGASGARTLVTLLHALRRRDARIGVVSLCLGGGEAVAMAVERV